MTPKLITALFDNGVFKMQGAGSPQRTFSVLDRLLLTHPVWLQLSINRDSALYILLREPVGVRPRQPSIRLRTYTQRDWQ